MNLRASCSLGCLTGSTKPGGTGWWGSLQHGFERLDRPTVTGCLVQLLEEREKLLDRLTGWRATSLLGPEREFRDGNRAFAQRLLDRAQPARRHVDDARERGTVGEAVGEAQVGDHIAHLRLGEQIGVGTHPKRQARGPQREG